MNPTISVIIRLYNGIEYLNETIDSVINQEYTNWELIIGVNGHGADGGNVFKQAQTIIASKNDIRLQVKNYPDVKGGAQALNALAADSKHEWVAILDADDTWDPLKLSCQVNIINTVLAIPEIIGTHCEYFGERRGGPNLPSGLIDNKVFREYNPIINSSVLIKKNLIEFTDKFYGLDDYDQWCRLSLEGKVFYNIGKSLTNHRVYSNSQYNASNKQDVDGLRKYYFG
jgi:glycosyltransferase involved in cell wall biosynthesis